MNPCVICKTPIQKPVGRGRTKITCSDECREKRNEQTRRARLPHVPNCSTEDCDKQARSKKHPLCEMHYGRMRRYGSLEPGCCSYCGEQKASEKGLYCSRACRLRMDRARRYGLTAEQALAYEAERRACEICKGDFDPEKREPYWDHDHQTGKLRGLLCKNCNFAIGLLRDSVTSLSAAISYLDHA